MRYTSEDNALLSKKRASDMGFDVPFFGSGRVIEPFETVTFDTRIKLELPVFGKVRRFLAKLLFGADITGIGCLVWPRSRQDILIKAGVVDPQYRGPIKIKVYNPNKYPVHIHPGDFLAQLVPSLSIDLALQKSDCIDENTDRGSTGGINLVR